MQSTILVSVVSEAQLKFIVDIKDIQRYSYCRTLEVLCKIIMHNDSVSMKVETYIIILEYYVK